MAVEGEHGLEARVTSRVSPLACHLSRVILAGVAPGLNVHWPTGCRRPAPGRPGAVNRIIGPASAPGAGGVKILSKKAGNEFAKGGRRGILELAP